MLRLALSEIPMSLPTALKRFTIYRHFFLFSFFFFKSNSLSNFILSLKCVKRQGTEQDFLSPDQVIQVDAEGVGGGGGRKDVMGYGGQG